MPALLIALLLAPPPATVELYTMGPGDELFSAFGHAAVCVRDARSPSGRCYNYGTADFRTPLPLTWSFIRGRARFWVSVTDQPSMLRFYARDDRTVWRQVLPLPAAQAERLAVALEASTDERVKYYRYHHFDDNCTTRVRDLIDAATDGALGRAPVDRALSFRAWAREGFAGHWPLLVATELFLGRSADRPTDSWSAMFLPSELRAEVERRLGATPERLVTRRAPLSGGSTALGHLAFLVAGVLLALAPLGGSRLGPVAWRISLVPVALVLGLLGAALSGLALLSTFPEVVRNEGLLAYWPTDLALPAMPRRFLRSYITLRLVVLFLLAVGHVAWLTQPLSPLLCAAMPLYAALVSERWSARRRVPSPPATPQP